MYKVDSYGNSFNGDMGLVCGQIHKRFKEYVVKTTDKEIKEMVEKAKNDDKEKVKFIFTKTFENITKYSDKELNEHYEKKTEEWFNWCNDVALFYCSRFVLFDGKFKIPLIRL